MIYIQRWIEEERYHNNELHHTFFKSLIKMCLVCQITLNILFVKTRIELESMTKL